MVQHKTNEFGGLLPPALPGMSPKKRVSGGAPQGKSKAAKTSKGGANQSLPVPPHAVMMPHIKIFDEWMKLNSICMHLW